MLVRLQGMFTHFVDALRSTCSVVALNSSTDYRVQMLQQGRQQQEQKQQQLQQLGGAGTQGAGASAHEAAAAGSGELALSSVYASPLCTATEQHLAKLWAAVTQVRG